MSDFYHIYNLKKLTVLVLLPVVKFSLQVIFYYCNVLLNISSLKCNCVLMEIKT